MMYTGQTIRLNQENYTEEYNTEMEPYTEENHYQLVILDKPALHYLWTEIVPRVVCIMALSAMVLWVFAIIATMRGVL